MSMCGLSSINSMTFLFSAQSSLKSVDSVKSVQISLRTEAEIYEPDIASGFAGDPEKADALTKKAQSLNGKVDRICSKVQTSVQDAAQKAFTTKPQDSEDDDQSPETEDDVSTKPSRDVPICNSNGKITSAETASKNKFSQQVASPYLHLDQIC